LFKLWYFHYEYSADSAGEIIRHDEGYCHRTVKRVLKKRDKTCARFVLRKTEPENALLFRKQQLLKEIGEWTEFLKKIKDLGELVIQIQELFSPK